MGDLATEGWIVIDPGLDSVLESLRHSAFSEQGPGQRCLLDLPLVREVSGLLRRKLVEDGFLPEGAVAIQAIAFDKTKGTNWKVTWHQDVMFPFAQPVTSPDFELPGIKDGIAYARPPRDVLENLLAVRLHLDDCDETNGPLRIAPGSHQAGILKSTEIHSSVEKLGTATCLAKEGEALLMKPLLLHASSPASAPRHRRVLHLVYHFGQPMAETWHRAL